MHLPVQEKRLNHTVDLDLNTLVVSLDKNSITDQITERIT